MIDTSRITVAISGEAGGIGQALRQALQSSGIRTIGIDVRGAEVCADLSMPDGRARAVTDVLNLCGGRLDGLVCAAGLGGTMRPPSRIVSVNYFGAIALLEGLLPALRCGSKPAAVAVTSVSATSGPWENHPIEQACLAGDEALACHLADTDEIPYAAYGCSKRALAVMVRRLARSWGTSGVRVNAIAPGPTDTPLHQAALADPKLGPATRAFVPPLGYTAAPHEIARSIAFLLSPQASFIHGSVLFADGGCDAAMRPDMI